MWLMERELTKKDFLPQSGLNPGPTNLKQNALSTELPMLHTIVGPKVLNKELWCAGDIAIIIVFFPF